MTGVLYGKIDEDDEIHLWKNRDENCFVTRCGRGPEVSRENPEIEILVTQKESFKRGNEGYCSECLNDEPKIEDSWL